MTRSSWRERSCVVIFAAGLSRAVITCPLVTLAELHMAFMLLGCAVVCQRRPSGL